MRVIDQSTSSSILSVLPRITIQVSFLSRDYGLEQNMDSNLVKQETSSVLLSQVPLFSPHLKFVSMGVHH